MPRASPGTRDSSHCPSGTTPYPTASCTPGSPLREPVMDQPTLYMAPSIDSMNIGLSRQIPPE